MQNRYTGDIGDYAKYGLLRHLSDSYRLGVAWYLYPDEAHNSDGKYISYLRKPNDWRHYDSGLFDSLKSIVDSDDRSVFRVEQAAILNDCVYSGDQLVFEGSRQQRARKRSKWFIDVLSELQSCDLIFADPDNGLCEDTTYQHHEGKHWKRIPLSEAQVLSAGRTAVIYHHNTRRAGGHAQEIQYWLRQLSNNSLAVYWRRGTSRTFFILNPTKEIEKRAVEFVDKWAEHCELHRLLSTDKQATRATEHTTPFIPATKTKTGKQCPECGHQFTGNGWGGIDAHWKANHTDIMPYKEAFSIIKKGKKPSDYV